MRQILTFIKISKMVPKRYKFNCPMFMLTTPQKYSCPSPIL